MKFLPLFAALAILILVILGYSHANRIYAVPTNAMEPTIHQGQFVSVGLWYYHLLKPKRWDVVVFERDTPTGKLLDMKRVVGLPGERIDISTRGLAINGLELSPPLEIPPPAPATEKDLHPISLPLTLAKDEYFLVGDHTGTSFDSRYFGPVHVDQIRGKVMRVFDHFSLKN